MHSSSGAHRNPIDTCVSCFLGEFGGGNNYTYRMEWLAEAYHLHYKAGDIAADLLSNKIIDVHYEALVQDIDGEISRIGDALGLSRRNGIAQNLSCDTRSAAQVRKPVYTNSIERWRRYGSKTDLLRTELAKHGVIPDPTLEQLH